MMPLRTTAVCVLFISLTAVSFAESDKPATLGDAAAERVAEERLARIIDDARKNREQKPSFDDAETDKAIAKAIEVVKRNGVRDEEAPYQLDESEACISKLVADLKSKIERERLRAVVGLGIIGAPAKDAIPSLIAVLSKDTGSVRKSAAKMLERIGHSEGVITALGIAVKDEDAEVSWAAAEALIKIGKDEKSAVKALVNALKEKRDVSLIAKWFDDDDLDAEIIATLNELGKSDPKIKAQRHSIPLFKFESDENRHPIIHRPPNLKASGDGQ